MWRKNPAIVRGLAWAMTCLVTAGAWADSLYLSGDRVITGRITAETAQSVTIEASEGRFTFPRTQIKRITRDSPAQNQLVDVADLLQRGELDRALALYKAVGLEEKLAPDTLETLLLQKLSATAGAVVATTTTAAILADRILDKPDAPMELLLLASALSATSAQHDNALKLLQKIPLPPPRKSVWPESTLSVLLNRIADAAVARQRGDLIGATAALAAQITPGNGGGTDYLAQFSRIDQLRRNSDYLRATALFRPEYFLHRADLFTPLAERVLTSIIASGNNPHSIAALESARLTILPYVDPRMREMAVRTLISSMIAAGRMHDAQAIADEISSDDPDLGAIASHLVEFFRRKQQLQDDKPLEKYKLAAWARKMGLLNESRGLFAELRKDPRFAENAAIQLQLIEHSRCTAEVDHLRRLFDAGRLDHLKVEAQKFLDTAPPQAHAAKARDLVQLAGFQQWSTANMVQDKAEAEYQQAERLANRGEYDAALTQLNKIQVETGNTAAASRAKNLRDRIIREKTRQRIEAARYAASSEHQKSKGSGPAR